MNDWFARNISTRWDDYGWAWRLRARGLRSEGDPLRYRGGTRRPVMVLPGVYETWHFMEPIAERLHGLGHPVHVVPDFGRNVLPTPEMTELARRYLVDNELRDVVIVGHSKGGLIGKALMLTQEGMARVAGMVAINSPFTGSAYAHYVPFRTLREFVPTHETIRTLAANAEVNARITSIFSQWDPVIPNGSRLEGATNIELAIGGHFRLLDRPELLDAVARAVEDA